MPKLTPKQEVFVKAYVETQNATEAAVQAYDPSTRAIAQVMGSENLSKPIVAQAVDSLTRTMRERTSQALAKAINKAEEMIAGDNEDQRKFGMEYLIKCAALYAESTDKPKINNHLHVKAPSYPKR